jgi:hypothetical protein
MSPEQSSIYYPKRSIPDIRDARRSLSGNQPTISPRNRIAVDETNKLQVLAEQCAQSAATYYDSMPFQAQHDILNLCCADYNERQYKFRPVNDTPYAKHFPEFVREVIFRIYGEIPSGLNRVTEMWVAIRSMWYFDRNNRTRLYKEEMKNGVYESEARQIEFIESVANEILTDYHASLDYFRDSYKNRKHRLGYRTRDIR